MHLWIRENIYIIYTSVYADVLFDLEMINIDVCTEM